MDLLIIYQQTTRYMSNMPEQLEAILVNVSPSENIMDYTVIV